MKLKIITFLALMLLACAVHSGTIVPEDKVVTDQGDTVTFYMSVTDSGPLQIWIAIKAVDTLPENYWSVDAIITPDSDADGVADVRVIRQLPVYTPPDPYDVNRDGVVDGGDLVLLLSFLLGVM